MRLCGIFPGWNFNWKRDAQNPCKRDFSPSICQSYENLVDFFHGNDFLTYLVFNDSCKPETKPAHAESAI
jgi:hypothetical protein